MRFDSLFCGLRRLFVVLRLNCVVDRLCRSCKWVLTAASRERKYAEIDAEDAVASSAFHVGRLPQSVVCDLNADVDADTGHCTQPLEDPDGVDRPVDCPKPLAGLLSPWLCRVACCLLVIGRCLLSIAVMYKPTRSCIAGIMCLAENCVKYPEKPGTTEVSVVLRSFTNSPPRCRCITCPSAWTRRWKSRPSRKSSACQRATPSSCPKVCSLPFCRRLFCSRLLCRHLILDAQLRNRRRFPSFRVHPMPRRCHRRPSRCVIDVVGSAADWCWQRLA